MSATSDMVDIIKNIVQQELDKRDCVVLCRVENKVSENFFDLTLISDPTTVIHNIPSMIKYDIKRGDYVYIYKIGNNVRNSFICYKIIQR